ncbi:sigma-54 dependent transcriptional regulator, partial [bacterium]|nr:sigma-54 dependent transcriptional regulator [bacterium]
MSKILVVDDNPSMRESLGILLESRGYDVELAEDGATAKKMIDNNEYDVILTDLRMGDIGGLQVLKHSQQKHPDTEVIVVTAHGTIQTAVEATRLGAYDYITTPCENEEILIRVEKALERKNLKREVGELKEKIKKEKISDRILFASDKMKKIMELVEKVADTNASVLILGESGTGKELLAKYIHDKSKRKDKSFIPLNCAAIPETLLESELFGIEKGVATGVGSRQGKFELASGGTIFLDEIGDMSLITQSKVLRVLNDQEFQRVGGKDDIKVDVRVLAATNKDLLQECNTGKFRDDLYYRLNVVSINLPPLRERIEDIPLLAKFFLERSSLKFEKKVKNIDKAAIVFLEKYDWPGNIRQLENACTRAVILADGSSISIED